MKKPLKIGVGHADYNARRCFSGSNIDDVVFVKQFNLLPRQIMRRLPGLKQFSGAATCFLPSAKIDAYHTFNEVVFNRKPWFVSFESVLPRMWKAPKAQRQLLAYLARDECRAILAMSDNALLHLKSRNQPCSVLDNVLSKTKVLYPAIEDHRSSYRLHQDRPADRDVFKMLFVGNEFFRKGGQFVVAAFERLRQHYPVELTVVSSMKEANYVMPTTPGDADLWRHKMNKLGVTLLKDISSIAVRDLLANSDLLLLPTMDDSFGYSVIEAMATGVVPVVSGIRALPEIVTDKVDGLVLSVPTTKEGRLDVKRQPSNEIEDALVGKLEWFFENKLQHGELSRAARATYENRFSKDRLAKELCQIYSDAHL
jgi:glycosyltransferase involved in cell wall biosynthesis